MLDPENLCQWHYGRWVPNMVMNSDEIIKSIRAKVPVESLYVIKKYIQLGGHVGRYLPKDCYYLETGTAETAICIKLSEKQTVDPKIVIEVNNDSNTHLSVFDRKLSYLLKKMKEVFLNI